MTPRTRRAIWWIRRGLRLSDNQALTGALEAAEEVIPTFIIDPRLVGSRDAGVKRLAFLWEGLRVLDADLRSRGSCLVVRRGNPPEVLSRMADETGGEMVFAEEDFTPFSRRREAQTAGRVDLCLVGGLTVHPPDAVHKADGSPYTVFTPYSRAWKGLPSPSARSVLPSPEGIPTPADVPSLPIPDEPAAPATNSFPAGEAEAQRRLHAFADGPGAGIDVYHEGRDRLDWNGTSQLSPYMHLGMLSARQAVVTARLAADRALDGGDPRGAETWLDELIWREFYITLLAHFPGARRASLRPEFRAIEWVNDEAQFRAWCEGRTGYPIVDAAMRQLKEMGWMHNRARMIAATFLVKHLLIDWRWGERYFQQQLIDGDPAANNGGWQWTAGTGTDAAPYSRVFNPTTQGKKHDPQGDYIRRWVPELAGVSVQYLHQPWSMPQDVQQRSGCRIGIDYPAPLVDHAGARVRALDAYRRARERRV